ncbi:DUF1816 domain-containing protein [Leptolyngbya sp. FACHB-671]|uniref:DUF1816 domain-containing protein n=1 Tax=unclassified Leptolyngbya TaxID=2650499 RepID=UPI00168969B6|nr:MULTISPECIES: DUF1816 domain-containing protein [unclassified Leptolyngbya]MBD1871456.1 DUF1816 domain-containing protein [Cyanobacteria bacterium FACHB-471]MBD1996064.1 DUF1816 domain-containing protein [Leptolyngbya sp. FACHB-541]MBD2072214.1 DUF1816 domain-containing protein [Leptolyngbya sp. FACHB-671]
MKELWTNLLQTVGLAWWVEILTDNPRCTYYFGPFASASEAEAEKAGYIEDLEQEGAQGIKVAVKRCKPDNLTIYEEIADRPSRGGPAPVFSGQV